MAKENKGLGRGLSAMFDINDIDLPETEQPSDNPVKVTLKTEKAVPAEKKEEQQTEIDLFDIDPNYEQPRKNFEESSLYELAESIRTHGIIQPLVLNKMGTRYMIIAGERRYRAAKLAGLTKVPAIIKTYTPQQIREISLVENLQREDLNPIEAARAIKALMEEFSLTQEETARRIGKNRSTVTNTLRLLTLSDEVIELVEKGQLSAGHARALIAIEDKWTQIRLARKAVAEGLSVRAVEKLVRKASEPEPETKEKPPENIELKSLVTDMQRVFATKVSAVVGKSGEKGRIYIDFYTKDDLDRLVTLVEKWKASNL